MTSLATPMLAALLVGPGMLPHAADSCIGAPSLTTSGTKEIFAQWTAARAYLRWPSYKGIWRPDVRMTMLPADTGCLSDAGDVAATGLASEFICMTLHATA